MFLQQPGAASRVLIVTRHFLSVSQSLPLHHVIPVPPQQPADQALPGAAAGAAAALCWHVLTGYGSYRSWVLRRDRNGMMEWKEAKDTWMLGAMGD